MLENSIIILETVKHFLKKYSFQKLMIISKISILFLPLECGYEYMIMLRELDLFHY